MRKEAPDVAHVKQSKHAADVRRDAKDTDRLLSEIDELLEKSGDD